MDPQLIADVTDLLTQAPKQASLWRSYLARLLSGDPLTPAQVQEVRLAQYYAERFGARTTRSTNATQQPGLAHPTDGAGRTPVHVHHAARRSRYYSSHKPKNL